MERGRRKGEWRKNGEAELRTIVVIFVISRDQ